MKALYKLHIDLRNGTLYGLFICEKEKWEQVINDKTEIYFGEVNGKHSDVYGNLGENDYTLISTDPAVIEFVENNKLCFGYNPFNFSPFTD